MSEVGFEPTPRLLDCDLNAAPWTARPSWPHSIDSVMLNVAYIVLSVLQKSQIHNKMTNIPSSPLIPSWCACDSSLSSVVNEVYKFRLRKLAPDKSYPIQSHQIPSNPIKSNPNQHSLNKNHNFPHFIKFFSYSIISRKNTMSNWTTLMSYYALFRTTAKRVKDW